MADGIGPPNLTLLQAILAFSGALLAPIIGTIAALLSRSPLQRRQQEIEFNIKRLEALEKAVAVGKSISNSLGTAVDLGTVLIQYGRILNSMIEQAPPDEGELLPFERVRLPWRLIMVPKPTSRLGWIASSMFYLYLFTSVSNLLVILQWHYSPTAGNLHYIFGSLGLAMAARYWAIWLAKAAARRNRERFLREASTDSGAPTTQKS